MKSREHIFNDHITDFAFGLEHLERFITKQLLQAIGLGVSADRERAGAGKTTIGGDQVQVGIKLLKIAKGVNVYGSTGNGISQRDGML